MIAHYYNINDFGIKFYRMSYNDFVAKAELKNSGALKDLIRYFKVKPTKIKGRSIREIIKAMEADKVYTSTNKYVWCAESYNFVDHNCQDFVRKFIKEVGAIREGDDAMRGLHNYSKNVFSLESDEAS